MCTSQGLLSKAHDVPLYLFNHAYDGLRCGAPTVIREAALEYQTMIWSAKLYTQRLATLNAYYQLIPMSRRHHSYAVGGRGGAMRYKRGFLTVRTLYFTGPFNPFPDPGIPSARRRDRPYSVRP